MKKTLQTKRSKSAKSNFKKLYAKAGRQRRMKAATTADAHTDLESDIPNVGLGRALLVILLLHVVAIGAVYTHIKFFGDKSDAGNTSKVAVTATQPVEPAPTIVQESAPVVAVETTSEGLLSERYIVVTGDTYTRIAEVRNVDLTALRALNDDRPLRAGVVLDLPAELSSRPVSVAAAPVVAPPVVEQPEPQIAKAIVVPETEAPVAIVVKPMINHNQVTSIGDSGQRYVVKSGDTLWRISQRYGVSREKLLKLNGITDASKLQIGFNLKIPAN